MSITVVTEIHAEKVFTYVNQGEKSVWGRWNDIADPFVTECNRSKAWAIAMELVANRPKKKVRIPRARPGRQA